MTTYRRSLVINFFASSGATLVNFVVVLLMARLLTAEQIGIFSMTVVITNIAHIFRDFGVSSYVQREPDLTIEKMRSAIGVFFVSSWSICMLLFVLSAPLAGWLGEPDVAPVARVLAIGFFLIPFASITNSLLVRRFEADKQAKVTAVSTLVYACTAVLMGNFGFGAMSLAWANLANIFAGVLMLVTLRPAGMPWIPSLRHWREVTRFGAGSLLTNCADAFNHAIPDLFLGKAGSARDVGLFSRANGTVSMFSFIAGSTVSYGAVSYMAQAHQRKEALAPVIARATALLTGVGWPALMLTALFGEDLVRILYGPGWEASIPAILPLAVAAALAMLFQYLAPALTAIGRPYVAAFPILVSIIARLVLAVALYDGQIASFAWVVCAASVCMLPLLFAIQQRQFVGEPGAFARSLAPSVGVTLLMLPCALTIRFWLPDQLPSLARMALAGPLLALTWYASIHITRHPLLPEVEQLSRKIWSRLAALTARGR